MMLDTKYEGAVLRISKHCQKDFCVMHTLVYAIHNTLGWGHFWHQGYIWNTLVRGLLVMLPIKFELSIAGGLEDKICF